MSYGVAHIFENFFCLLLLLDHHLYFSVVSIELRRFLLCLYSFNSQSVSVAFVMPFLGQLVPAFVALTPNECVNILMSFVFAYEHIEKFSIGRHVWIVFVGGDR